MEKNILTKARLLEIKNGFFTAEQISLEKIRQYAEKIAANKYALNSKGRSLVRVVLTGGVFDILHPGHIFLLENAKAAGDLLIVVVASDATVRHLKRREPIHTQEERAQLVAALKPVDAVFFGTDDKYAVLNVVKPTAIFYGYDQKPDESLRGKFELIHLKERFHPEKYKTSAIIGHIKELH